MSGTLSLLGGPLRQYTIRKTNNTSFVERHNETDRPQNSRKRRKIVGLSKNLSMHRVVSHSNGYRFTFC